MKSKRQTLGGHFLSINIQVASFSLIIYLKKVYNCNFIYLLFLNL